MADVDTGSDPQPNRADVEVSTSDSPQGSAAGNSLSQSQAAPGTDQKPNDPNSAAGDQKSGKPRKRSRSQREARRLQRENDDLRRSSAAALDRIAQLEQTVQGLQSSSGNSDPPPKPDFKDYDDPEKYARDFAKWEKASKKAADSPPAPKTPQPKVDPRVLEFHERGEEKLGEEFTDLLNANVRIDPAMANIIMDSDLGPEIYVHLANNPKEARKIAKAPLREKVKLLEALEERGKKGELDVEGLDIEEDEDGDDEQDDEQPAQKREKKGTKAPTPPDTRSDLDGEAAGNALEIKEGLSMDEYARRRAKQMSRRNHHYS